MRRKGMLPWARRFDAADDERDREFLDVVRDFAASQDELAAIIDMPEYSLAEIRDHLRKRKNEREGRTRIGEWWEAIQQRVARGWGAMTPESVGTQWLNKRGRHRHGVRLKHPTAV